MDVATTRAVAEALGYEEVLHSASEGIIIFEAGEEAAYVSIWYHSRTVGVSLPHPRRERIMSFFFDVDERKLHEVLSHPWLNEALHYAGFDTSSSARKSAEAVETALRQQIYLLECEEVDIAKEKAFLQVGFPNAIIGFHYCKSDRLYFRAIQSTFRVVQLLFSVQKRLKDLPQAARRAPSGGAAKAMMRLPSGGESVLPELERKKRELAEEIKYLESQKSRSEAKLQRVSIQSRNNHRNSSIVQSEFLKKSDAKKDVPSQESEEEEEEEESDSSPGRNEFRSGKSIFLNRSVSSVQRDSPGRYKGNRCMYSFSNDDYQEEFAKAWGEKLVGTVALSRGYIIVYDDGGVAWWDIPLALDEKFRDEKVRLPPIKFACLGPEDHYFVKFVNGKMEWVAKDSFQGAMRSGIEEHGLYVDRVSLGPSGSWVILWSNGTAHYEGIPSDLAAIIARANEEGPRLREINMGPGGEWFAIFADNSVQANNLADSLHRALGKIKQEGGRVRSIVFGEMNAWYVRYWDGKQES